MMYETNFLIALFLTIIIETIVLFILIKYKILISKKDALRINNYELLAAGIFASGLTLPYLWFVLPIAQLNKFWYILIGEISVVMIEAMFYKFFLRMKFKQALIISLICNLTSFLIGLLIL